MHIYNKNVIMKKIVRLSENDLTRLIKRVIEEQSTTQTIDYTVLEKFLNRIEDSPVGSTSRWVLDSNNPKKRKGSVILTGNEATIPMDYVNKPLVWSLVVMQQDRHFTKKDGAIFQIFSENGKLYYGVSLPKDGRQNVTKNFYEELTPKTVGYAIQKFNKKTV